MSTNGHDDRKPLGILHLSDLHFKAGDQPEAVLGPLREDLSGKEIHYVVISGDLVDKGDVDAFALAAEFTRRLQEQINVPWTHFILCPGNHDVQEVDELFITKKKLEHGDDLVKPLDEKFNLVRVASKYPERFAAYRALYKELLNHELEHHLSRPHFFPDHGLQFVALNTCHRIDEYRRKDADLDPAVFAQILRDADEQSKDFDRPLLRIAVWHHAVLGQWCMPNPGPWVERLAKNGVALLLHGDVHEPRAQIAQPFKDSLYIAGSGSLHAADQKTGWCYNFLTIDPNFSSIKVQVREQDLANGPFDGHYKFGESKARVDHFLLSEPRVSNNKEPVPQPPTSAPPKPTFRTFISKLPTVDPYVVGREKELAFLDQAWANPSTNVVQIIASGGTGKTALLDKWFRRHLKEANVFGWSFYSQGTSQDRQTSSDPFFAEAFRFFEIDLEPNATVYAKADALAEKLADERVLVMLDGIEPLQDANGDQKDQALKYLLKGLAINNAGLVLCTTRIPINDIPPDGDRTLSRELHQLSSEASVSYLSEIGVKGEERELQGVAKDYGNHALALTLLGHYLVTFCEADVRRAIGIPKLMVDELRHGQHARRVMIAYETTFAGRPELEILKGLGYFNRPADPKAMRLVVANQAGLEYKAALRRLRELHLILADDGTGNLDCHPLIREHYSSYASPLGHERLYRHYQKGPKYPDNLEDMTPLFSAVYHGCKAGYHTEVLDKVFHSRLHRYKESYLVKKLGAFGTELSLLANFFVTPWTEPIANLPPSSGTWVINAAAYALRALGQLSEAEATLREGIKQRIDQENEENIAIGYNNLSELLLTLGEIKQAIEAANRAVEFADLSGKTWPRIAFRTALADAFHQFGDVEKAAEWFAAAESIQLSKLAAGVLGSVGGYRSCDFLLDHGEVAVVKSQASRTLAAALKDGTILDIALHRLSLARAGDSACLDIAIEGLRQAAELDELPRGLLARGTQRDLDEVYTIASRSGMRLYLTDYYLKQAALDLANNNPTKAREHTEKAAELIEATGYHRRDPDLARLRQQLALTP